MGLLSYFRKKEHLVKADSAALFAASRDPRTPVYAKILGFIVLAYLFSPIDLIPDFIPVLGWVDDIIIAWLGMVLIKRLIPPEVLRDAQLSGHEFEIHLNKTKRNFIAITALFSALILVFFILLIVALVQFIRRF